MIRTLLLMSISLGGVACKRSANDTPAPPPGPAVVVVTADAARVGEFPLAAGETYAGGKVLATNLVSWKVEDGSSVQLGIVTTGKTANGREEGVLRAYHAGSDTHDVGPKYSLDPTLDHWSELKLVGNNRVMFRYGEAGQGATARNAVLLTWDVAAKRVRIAKRWTGTTAEKEPEWLLSGEYKVAPESVELCMKVIARMVSCQKDPAFRDAIFRRVEASEKDAMQTHFDTHVEKWKRPAEAKAQCQTWAGADYVDTHFSEPTKLKRLAGEVDFKCGFFASEIVDEGGLTAALTVK
jgi:hypothetical protein